MRKTVLAILSCFVLALAVEAAGAASEVTALKIFEKSFDSQTKKLSYELWNESNRTVTAWRLSLARSDPHGHAQRSILDQDFFDRQPSVELGSKLGPIAPGASVTAQWHLDVGGEDPGPTALSLKLIAIVFDDLTWEGDSDAAAVILEARAARVGEIGKVVAELEKQERQPRSGQEWSAALKQRAQRLKRLGTDPDSSAGSRREVAAVLAATQLELARWLEDASREVSLAPDPYAALGFLTRSLRERYEAGLRATLGDGLAPSSAGSGKGGER